MNEDFEHFKQLEEERLKGILNEYEMYLQDLIKENHIMLIREFDRIKNNHE